MKMFEAETEKIANSRVIFKSLKILLSKIPNSKESKGLVIIIVPLIAEF